MTDDIIWLGNYVTFASFVVAAVGLFGGIGAFIYYSATDCGLKPVSQDFLWRGNFKAGADWWLYAELVSTGARADRIVLKIDEIETLDGKGATINKRCPKARSLDPMLKRGSRRERICIRPDGNIEKSGAVARLRVQGSVTSSGRSLISTTREFELIMTNQGARTGDMIERDW